MKVEWNKVTWYSKLIAFVLFIALPFAGFWLGMRYGATAAPTTTVAIAGGNSADYYSNVAEWQTDSRFDGGFSIAYPIDFQVDDDYATTPTASWRLNEPNNALGLEFLTITIPSAFEPQTNFAGATLTIGESSSTAALADCLTPDLSDGPATSSTTTTINGAQFYVFESSSVGAGNLYETTSYRTLHSGACYAVEYTIHSSQIANYPPQYNLQPFNEAQVTAVLDRIVGTFNF